MKNWYSIKNRSSGVVDISLHDEIGLWGISAADFISELRGHDEVSVINLSIHSPGGSVLDGLAMYNALAQHPAKIYGNVEGVAASAASFILMASDSISMPEDAFIMIHNPYAGVVGDADEMREMADVVEKMQNTITNIYHKRTGADVETLAKLMKVETWMNADEALDLGFIDTITEPLQVAAKIQAFSKHFKEMPVDGGSVGVEDVETIKDFEKCLRDAGLSKGLAQSLTSRAKVVFRGDPDEPDDALTRLSEALDKVKIPAQISETATG